MMDSEYDFLEIIWGEKNNFKGTEIDMGKCIIEIGKQKRLQEKVFLTVFHERIACRIPLYPTAYIALS